VKRHTLQIPSCTRGECWLRRIGEYARLAAIPFLEIWIVNEHGDPAQQVPLRPR
jgi:hypothetical protein